MRKLCLLLLFLCAVAEAYWEEKNWWWDELWEEEFELVEPGEPGEAEPLARRHQLVAFDANWKLQRLELRGSGQEGERTFPWQPKENYHYRQLGSDVELALFKFWGTQSISHLAAMEWRDFPKRQTSSFQEGEQALVLAHKSESLPLNFAWRIGQGGKTFPTQARYNSVNSARGLEVWGKGKLWQFKVQWEQLEKLFPLWQAQSYFRDAITYSASYRPKEGWRLLLKGEAWQREYPLGEMLTSKKQMWEVKLEGPLWLWKTELSYLSRLQRYPYQSTYDYFLTRGRAGFSRSFSSTRQFFVGLTQEGQAYFQQDKSYVQKTLLLRWQERLGPIELTVRCEVGERKDEPNPFLIQFGLEQKYE